MKMQTLLTLTAGSVVLLAGCAGPGATGRQARMDAQQRISDFSARYTFDRAEQDLRAGQFDRALASVDAIIAQSPEVAPYHHLRGRILLETNELEDAVSSFLTAIDHDPNMAESHYFIGIVFQRWSDDEEAYSHYNKAFEIESDDAHYLMATTEALIALGELDTARALVTTNMTFFENAPMLRHMLGQIALLEGNATEAARLYAEARLLDPDNVIFLEELAWVQYEAGQFADCQDSVKQLQMNADEPRTDLTHLGARCLTMLGRTTEAYNIYMTLARRNPSNAALWIEFGTLAWKLGDYRRVAECSVRTIGLAPNRFEGYMLEGMLERHEGRTDAALTLLRQSADRTTDSVLPHLLLGRMYEENGQQLQALSIYAEAVGVDPASKEARQLYTTLAQSMQLVTAED